VSFRACGVNVNDEYFTVETVETQDAILDCIDGDAEPPYGLLLWESAVVLAKQVSSLGDDLWGTTVLELGCGTGLPGMVCARLGARVVQSDMFPYCISLAQNNASLNRITGIQYYLGNWRTWSLTDRFDFVIGADLFYDRTVHRDLINVITRSLKPGGTVIVTDPQRISTPAYLELMTTAGWKISTSTESTSVLQDGTEDVTFRVIDVHSISRSNRA
jgi:predicted nicotinamide N-methyase